MLSDQDIIDVRKFAIHTAAAVVGGDPTALAEKIAKFILGEAQGKRLQ